MTKRALLALVLLALLAGGASAFSFGGGLVFDAGWLGSQDHYAFGAWGFVDPLPFLELSVGLLGGTFERGHWDESATLFAMDISLLGKLPFYLGGMDIFPLLGVGGSLMIYPVLFIRPKFGAGADLDIRRNLFIRASVLGSYNFEVFGGGGNGFGLTTKVGIGSRR